MRNVRARKGAPDHEFGVVWSQDHARFNVCRDGVPTSGHATGRGVAIGLAIREARQEMLLTGDFIVVTSTLEGKKILEWDGHGET
jgi:hypothetical protein